MNAANKLRTYFMSVLALIAGLLSASNSAFAAENTPLNLLPSACHFTTEVRGTFSSLMEEVKTADCETDAKPSPEMVWLSLDMNAVQPKRDREYVLGLFRHWTERAVIQIHYDDDHMVSYDIGAYDFDQYWSVGNFVAFPAPARDATVTNVLIGLQNPSSIKLFRAINFVEADIWLDRQTTGRFLITIVAGVLLAMLCYNIALAAALRFDFHFHYCLFVSAIIIYNVTAYGLVAYYMPGTLSVGTQMNITILALGTIGLTGLHFLCAFLESGILSNRWKLAAKALGYAFFASAVLYVYARGWHADTIDLVFNLMSALGILMILAILTKALRQKSRAAIFYAIGWVLPIIGTTLRILRGLDLIPHSALVEYGMSIGMALETIILSIGIAERISNIRKDRDQAKIASARAVAASRAKSDFVAHMSHEIRNPINAILALSDLAESTASKKEQHDYIQRIQKSGNVLLSLLDDTLDFSKIEAGKVSIEKVNFATKDILDNVQAVISPKAEEKAVAFIIEGAETLPPTIVGDPTRLSQILINLSNNAVKFTATGTVTVSISCTPTSDNSMMLACRVTDTGIGMTEQQVSKLFQSYSQADDTVARKYGGTGLGLAISKQLVELMDGKIGVESKLGEGSCFYFEMPFDLPATSIHEEETLVDPALDETPNIFVSPLSDARILVVEDNQINQLLVSKILDSTEARYDAVSDGKEAIKMANSNHYDVILMDLNMPNMDGMEATKAIRLQQKNEHTPIIAMTGSDDVETRRACLNSGMDDHLIKPFKPVTMLAILEKWLRRKA